MGPTNPTGRYEEQERRQSNRGYELTEPGWKSPTWHSEEVAAGRRLSKRDVMEMGWRNPAQGGRRASKDNPDVMESGWISPNRESSEQRAGRRMSSRKSNMMELDSRYHPRNASDEPDRWSERAPDMRAGGSQNVVAYGENPEPEDEVDYVQEEVTG
jgi:hypothetical protein